MESPASAPKPISGPPSERLTPVSVATPGWETPFTVEPSSRLRPSTEALAIACWICAMSALKPASSWLRESLDSIGSEALWAACCICVSRVSMVLPAETAASAADAAVESPPVRPPSAAAAAPPLRSKIVALESLASVEVGSSNACGMPAALAAVCEAPD